MKKFLKALAVFACAIALVAGSVAATLAYLTDTATVTNTFTIGKVDITLDESAVTVYGEKVGTDRATENTYKLIPGHEYVKDPVIAVDGESENCWLFVKVENGIVDIEAPEVTEGTKRTIAGQLATNGWSLVNGETNVYGRSTTSVAGEKVKVFESFTLTSSGNFSDYTGKTITVTAYAVQADGFANANTAWTNAKSSFSANSQ